MKYPALSIAQLRRKEVIRLAETVETDPSDATIREAERLMNSYYRLAGLEEE